MTERSSIVTIPIELFGAIGHIQIMPQQSVEHKHILKQVHILGVLHFKGTHCIQTV